MQKSQWVNVENQVVGVFPGPKFDDAEGADQGAAELDEDFGRWIYSPPSNNWRSTCKLYKEEIMFLPSLRWPWRCFTDIQ